MWLTAVDIASTPGGHAGMQRSQPLQCSTSMVTVPRLLMRVGRRLRHVPRSSPRPGTRRRAGAPSPRAARARWLRCAGSGTAGSTARIASISASSADDAGRARRTRRASPSTRRAGCRGRSRRWWPATRCTRDVGAVISVVNVASFTSTRPPGRSFGLDRRPELVVHRDRRPRRATRPGGASIGPSATTTVLSVLPPRIMPP